LKASSKQKRPEKFNELSPLSARRKYLLLELAPFWVSYASQGLPGFIGPVPPPLRIRAKDKLSLLNPSLSIVPAYVNG
jgi:hypothetical protein